MLLSLGYNEIVPDRWPPVDPGVGRRPWRIRARRGRRRAKTPPTSRRLPWRWGAGTPRVGRCRPTGRLRRTARCCSFAGIPTGTPGPGPRPPILAPGGCGVPRSAEVHPPAPCRHAFAPEQGQLPLPEGGRSVGPNDAMPGQVFPGRGEDESDASGRRSVNVPVSSDRPARNFPDVIHHQSLELRPRPASRPVRPRHHGPEVALRTRPCAPCLPPAGRLRPPSCPSVRSGKLEGGRLPGGAGTHPLRSKLGVTAMPRVTRIVGTQPCKPSSRRRRSVTPWRRRRCGRGGATDRTGGRGAS
jgi:hypothetical protein